MKCIKDLGGKRQLDRGSQVASVGWGAEVHGEDCRPRGGSSTSEVGLVLLELHHQVVNVDELSPGREGPELRLGQHPVEAMIELDQLGQCSLVRENHGGIRLDDGDRNQVRTHPELRCS